MEMTRRKNRLACSLRFPIVLALMGVCTLSAFPSAAVGSADPPPAMQPGQPVDAYMATLTDAQARQVLADRLRDAAAPDARPPDTPAKTPFFEVKFNAAAKAVAGVQDRLASVFSAAADEEAQPLASVVDRLTGGKGAGKLMATLLGLAAIIGLGLAARQLVRRWTAGLRAAARNSLRSGKLLFFRRVVTHLLLDALSVAAYVGVTFAAAVLVFQQGDPSYTIVCISLVVSYYILAVTFAARVIWAPGAPAVRLFPLADPDAVFVYRWLVGISLLAGLIAGVSTILARFGVDPALSLMIRSCAGLMVGLSILTMIWQSRDRVSAAIRAEADAPFREALARSWVYFAALYVVVMVVVWTSQVLLTGKATILNLIISLFLIPAFIGLDQWIQRLLKIATGELPEIIDLSGDEPERAVPEKTPGGRKDIQFYVPLISRSFRLVLVGFLGFISLRLWGFDLAAGRIFTRNALGIITVVLTAYICWQIVKTKIDRKLKEEIPEKEGDMEEGGGSGSRVGTLLLLLRKFILAVLFVLVVLIVLSSMGVDIGPLIAGAGVVGLAIGFGAQTLVKDIIAGIFFLIDDAFRLGEYVEASGSKGMVEKISLRSLKLRHPRGMVYTVPYGDMGTMTNFSRDYIITKLDFRVRYDTNVNKVRKIIKEINSKIKSDPAMASVLLDNIKSQGVREMDDSAMVMRVKFKTIPGEQFVVRREVFRAIQEAFKENGIAFAHRNVTVYLPPEATQTAAAPDGPKAQKGDAPGKLDPKVLGAAAAAAAATLQAQEDEDARKAAEEEE